MKEELRHLVAALESTIEAARLSPGSPEVTNTTLLLIAGALLFGLRGDNGPPATANFRPWSTP